MAIATYVTLAPVTYIEAGKARSVDEGVRIQLDATQAALLEGSVSYVSGGLQVEDLPRVETLTYDSLSEFPITGSTSYLYLARDTDLLYSWDEAALEYQTVSQDNINAGDLADVTPTGEALMTAADQAAARDAIDAVDIPAVNYINSAINVEQEIGSGLNWSDGAAVRTAIQGVMNTYAGSRELVFPNREYLLGTAGVTGANRLTIPSKSVLTFKNGAYFVINQVDNQATLSNITASGTESAKVALTVDAVAGARTVTLPTGQGANFAPGDLIAFESRLIVTPNMPTAVTAIGMARQIFMVNYVSGDVVRMDRPLHDTFAVADGAVFSKITPARDIVIDGMKFLSGPGVTPGLSTGRMIRLERTLNARLGNLEIHNGIGGVFLFDAFDTLVDGLYVDRLLRKNDFAGYGICVEGASFNWTIDNLVGREIRHLFTTLFDSRTTNQGTVVAGTSNSITFASGASSVNDFYLGATVAIFPPGGGTNLFGIVTAYNGTTKVATLAPIVPWGGIVPNNTYTYSVYSAWGNPENGRVQVKGYGGLSGTAVIDTHEAGRNIVISGEVYGGALASEATGEFAGLSQAGAQIRSADTHLVNFYAHRMGREGVNFTKQSKNCSWDGGGADYNLGNGASLRGTNNVIRNVDLSNNVATGIYLDADSVDCVIENCRIQENAFHGIRDFGSTRTLIKGGSIPKSTAQTFSIYQLSATSRAEDVSCTGYGAGATGLTGTVAGALYRLFTDSDIRTNMPLVVNGSTVETQANKNVANGYLGLDASGKALAAQLPSYVDDVVEVANFAGLPVTGETGKIYIAQDTGHGYRWSGSAYVDLSALELLSILTSDDLILQRKSGTVVGRTPAQVKADLAIVAADVGAISLPKGYTTNHWYHCGLTGQATANIATVNRIVYQPWIVTAPVTIQALQVDMTVAGSAESLVRVGIYADDGTGKPGARIANPGSFSTGTGNAGDVATGGVVGVYAMTGLSIAIATPGLYWLATKTEGATGATMRAPSSAAQVTPNMSFGTTTPVASQVIGVAFETASAGALPTTAAAAGNTSPQGVRVLFRAA